MDDSDVHTFVLDDLTDKCACCFKHHKNFQRLIKINEDIEHKFIDVIQSEFLSKSYTKFVCGPCTDKIFQFSKFKDEMQENQRSLQDTLISMGVVAIEEVKIEDDSVGDIIEEIVDDDPQMDWKIETLDEVYEDEALKVMTQIPMKNITPFVRPRKSRPMPKQNSFFTCQICKDKVFTSRYHYRNHLMTEHPDRNANKYWTMTTVDVKQEGTVSSKELCSVCAKWITASSMDAHIKRMHSDEYFFFCDLCPQKFKVKRDIQYHVRKHMEKESRTRYQCEYCENSYLSTWALRNHFTMQHADITNEFICECGAAFKTQLRLNYHKKVVHEKGEYPCTICDKMYTSLPNLRLHNAQFHKKKDPCVVCGKLVAPGVFMRRHMMCHAPASFECHIDDCTKVFFGKTALTNHQASVHGLGEKVSCEVCGASFATKKVLSKHFDRTHKVTERAQCQVPGCTHTAARKDYFISHVKTHKDIDDETKTELILRIKAMKNLPW